MRSSKLARTALAVACVSTILLLGACSSDDNEPVTTAPTPTTVSGGEMSDTTTASQTIVDIASGNEDFSTLVSAVTSADLAGTLSGAGPFTVFAPTDDAFAELPDGTLESLQEPANKQQLSDILTYHVVPASVMAADVQPGAVKTVNGAEFTVSTEGGEVVITDGEGNKVNVVQTDIVGSNGVIHVIDGVLMPPAA
jgi:uncharacterized surface protein with fasciclin (FAS1) repeats